MTVGEIGATAMVSASQWPLIGRCGAASWVELAPPSMPEAPSEALAGNGAVGAARSQPVRTRASRTAGGVNARMGDLPVRSGLFDMGDSSRWFGVRGNVRMADQTQSRSP